MIYLSTTFEKPENITILAQFRLNVLWFFQTIEFNKI